MNSETILIVDDEPVVREFCCSTLARAGYQILQAATAEQALEVWSRNRQLIDLALVDVSLGRDTSAPIADELIARKVPFAFVTGYSDTAVLPEHLRKMPRLSKPYVLADVRRIIARLLEEQPGLCRSASAS